MPRHNLTYTVTEIETLVRNDAIRRGFDVTDVRMESFSPPMAYQLAQSGGDSRPNVRCVVSADNLDEKP